jgi:hypothetical protein
MNSSETGLRATYIYCVLLKFLFASSVAIAHSLDPCRFCPALRRSITRPRSEQSQAGLNSPHLRVAHFLVEQRGEVSPSSLARRSLGLSLSRVSDWSRGQFWLSSPGGLTAT